jgi:hypothetical protein
MALVRMRATPGLSCRNVRGNADVYGGYPMRPQRAKALIVIHDRNEAAELSAMLQNAGLQTAMAFNLGMGLR